MRLALIAWLAPVILALGCGRSTGTRVELWVEGDLSRADSLQSVEFVIRDAHLQPAGFEIYPDHRITSEWLKMALMVESFELRAGNRAPQRIATLEVEDGAYDRVYLRPTLLEALGADQVSLAIKNVMEPIAAQFETNGRNVKILLKLIVLPRSTGDEDLSIFAQDTQVNED